MNVSDVLGRFKDSRKTALVVGSLLTVVNQGESILTGYAHLADCPRIALNYLVPLLVSAYALSKRPPRWKRP